MVSKIKKSTFKSLKDCRNRGRRKSPVKKSNIAAKTSIFIASINESLLKIFGKLVRIGTPKSRKKGYQVLSKVRDDSTLLPQKLDFGAVAVTADRNRLPPLASPEKRTVVFDLDETLIHSKCGPPPEKFDFMVQPIIDGEEVDFFVQKRPGVDKLLAAVAGKYEVVVFTAGLAEYASLVLDRLDRMAVISHRLYRDSCKHMDGKYVKDLESLGRDLRRVAIIDDNPNAYALQPENAVPMKPFSGDLEDAELQRLMGFLEWADSFDDIRDAVKHYLSE